MERWKDVVGYEGFYQVSDLGRVRSVDRVVRHPKGGPSLRKGQIKSQVLTSRYGHLGVHLSKNGVGRSVHVHRLVAAAFLGPCPEGQQVRHGPNGVTDNSVSNLCYGTRSQDGLDKRRDGTHGGKPVRRSDEVEFISIAVAAEEMGCWPSAISDVCRGKRKSAGGYGWEYCSE